MNNKKTYKAIIKLSDDFKQRSKKMFEERRSPEFKNSKEFNNYFSIVEKTLVRLNLAARYFAKEIKRNNVIDGRQR
jgi:hypothetical protein